VIDSKIKLIKGIDSNGKITGSVYNKNIVKGDFFKIPADRSLISEYATDENGEKVNYVDSYLLSYSSLDYDIQYKHHYI
jgi:hypothetical protein